MARRWGMGCLTAVQEAQAGLQGCSAARRWRARCRQGRCSRLNAACAAAAAAWRWQGCQVCWHREARSRSPLAPQRLWTVGSTQPFKLAFASQAFNLHRSLPCCPPCPHAVQASCWRVTWCRFSSRQWAPPRETSSSAACRQVFFRLGKLPSSRGRGTGRGRCACAGRAAGRACRRRHHCHPARHLRLAALPHHHAQAAVQRRHAAVWNELEEKFAKGEVVKGARGRRRTRGTHPAAAALLGARMREALGGGPA